jgi:hypothetical protein
MSANPFAMIVAHHIAGAPIPEDNQPPWRPEPGTHYARIIAYLQEHPGAMAQTIMANIGLSQKRTYDLLAYLQLRHAVRTQPAGRTNGKGWFATY